MFRIFIKYFVLLSPLAITPINGFWWRSSTTEAPPEPVMKQIPLTYFRTYTYQPLAGNPLPFPLMSSTDYITNYAALANNPLFNSMMSMAPAAIPITGNELTSTKMTSSNYRPSKSYAGVNLVRSFNNGFVTTPTSTTMSTTTSSTTPKTTSTRRTTTTTTTTTTTPAPTTTTTTPATTSSTTTKSYKSDMESLTTSGPIIKADSLVNIESAYPTFDRKVYTNHFNINYNRPVYPYPEYSIYKNDGKNNNENVEVPTAAATSPTISAPPNIEFVPCMCPVNIQSTYPSPLTGNPSNSIFLTQGRTNSDVEAEGAEDLSSLEVENSTNLEEQHNIPMPIKVMDLQVLRVNDNDDDEDEFLNKEVLS